MKQDVKHIPEKRLNTGSISVTIWRNEMTMKNGQQGSYVTTTLQRNYQDAQGKWQNTNSLRVNDLPKAALALQKAYEYLVLKEKEEVEQ